MTKYKIAQGRHYADGAFFRVLNYRWMQNSIAYKVKFRENCWYSRGEVVHSGKNKLCGVSYGLFGVHRNSIRVAWKPHHEKFGVIILYAYYYKNNEGYFLEYLTEVETGDYFRVHINDILSSPSLSVVTKTEEVCVPQAEFYDMDICPLIHLHYPYFGGRDTAYWDMDINLKEI